MKLQFEERSIYKRIKKDFDNLVVGVIEGQPYLTVEKFLEGTSWKPEQVVEVFDSLTEKGYLICKNKHFYLLGDDGLRCSDEYLKNHFDLIKKMVKEINNAFKFEKRLSLNEISIEFDRDFKGMWITIKTYAPKYSIEDVLIFEEVLGATCHGFESTRIKLKKNLLEVY